MVPWGEEDCVFKLALRNTWKAAKTDLPYLDKLLPNPTDADLIMFFLVQLKYHNIDILNGENEIEEARLGAPR